MINVKKMSNGDQIDYGDYKEFKPPTIIKYFKKYDRVIKKEQLKKVNLIKIAKQRLKHGKDFLITNSNPVNSKDNSKSEDGIFSPKFGLSQFDDQAGTKDAYRCRCGKISGAIYVGELCSSCNTEVSFVDADLDIRGWIPLSEDYVNSISGDYYVINPAMYIHLADIMGKPKLDEIIKINPNKMSVDGLLLKDPDNKNPYAGIGITAFKEQFREILDYFYDKKLKTLKSKDKEGKRYEIIDEYQLILDNYDCIFTNIIPVYTAILRPHIESNSKIKLFQDNKYYDTIMNQYDIIENESGNMLSILPALYEVQVQFNELYDSIVTSLQGKEGLFRSQIAGMRIDYAMRAIIINGKDLMPDEVDIPYVAAIHFLELELIHLLKILDDITENEAYMIIQKALRVFNPRIHSLLQTIVNKSKNGISILLGR